ncbi:phage major capsid protein [Cryobacterium fucosi]|uniref:Phage major capsid protein n=1 Tax=Cryobacterium fucosi TaxID=1259157 RepID=A0A4R9B3I7_9MICO|nr:phage major capsid protein [Cryobacterium fucosi]TFD74730.1 phage major capsid protein [Cryobacterium fucosi]
MPSMVERLLEQRAQLWSQATALLDVADAEKRDLSGAENEQYDKITEDMRSLKERADRFMEDDRTSRDIDEALRSFKGREQTTESRLPELRKFVNGETKSFEIMPTVKELEEIRALSKGTLTAGGNTVPTTFYAKLWEHMVETATLLAGGATLFTTNSGETIDFPVTTSHGTAAAVAEGAVIGGTDPAFAKRSLGAFKYGEFALMSRELTQDTGVDLEGYLARVFGRNVGNLLGAKLIVGVGTTEPAGIMGSATLGITGGTGVAGAPTFDNLIDLFYSVISPYRNSPNASWLMKDTTAGVLRKVKDLNGQYIWQPSVIAGTPDRIENRPVFTDPNVAGTAVNARSVAFGDLSAYVVRIVNGIRFERSDDFAFNTDQIAFRAIVRGDGLLADQTGAVKFYQGAAT